MRILEKAKDGGSESPVDAYFLCEIKPLFSIAILKFNKGSRENYHTHAFNAFTWFICGSLIEQDVSGKLYDYKRSFVPKVTLKKKNHRVIALENSWCLTIRGRWGKEWTEYNEKEKKTITMTNGRRIIKTETHKKVTV